jgi:hypothetical protein
MLSKLMLQNTNFSQWFECISTENQKAQGLHVSTPGLFDEL